MASGPASVFASAPARGCLDCGLAVAGRSFRCGGCKAQRNRDREARWRQANPEAFAARMRRNLERNRASAIESTSAWQKANPDRVAAQRAKRKTTQTPEQRRDWYLRSKYGITLATERAMLAEQGGCAICHCQTLPEGQRWNVDHDHETGAVRGILCRACNLLLGQAGDDRDVLARAIAYLDQTSTKTQTA